MLDLRSVDRPTFKSTMAWSMSTLCVLALALTCSLQVNGLRVRRSNHVSNICSMWGNFHFKTFDGDVYQFQGNCEYNLVSDCHGPVQGFSVHVKRAGTPGTSQITRVLVTVGDTVIELTKKLVMVNNEIVKLPQYVAGVMLEDSSIYIKLYSKLGLSVTWNRDDAVMLELDSKYSNNTCGLCGDYNGVPVFNEFLSDGRVIGFTEFGNRHRIHSPNNFCEDPYEEFENEGRTVEKCESFRDDCSELLLDDPWSFCRNVLSPEPYIQACMMDMCTSHPGDTDNTAFLCSTLSEYSHQCSHAGGKPPNWRTTTFCAMTCPFNMEYSESGSPCLDTCTHTDTSSLCEEHKMDGCFCPPGTVFDDISERGCIPQEQCQCKHNKVYNTGEVLYKDDEECVCQQGRWICKSLSLPGVCAIEEGSHFNTFDGKEFTYHGNCNYVLSKACEDSKFIIVGQLIPCFAHHTDTCLKSIALLLNNDKSNALIIKEDGIIRHNGDIKLPYTTAEFTVFRPSSFHIMLQTTFGLQMQVQLVPVMQLYITLDERFQSKTCGLCGNFNMVLSDDLMTPQGVVEGTATSFANSWKAQSNCPDQKERLDDPCSYSIDSERYAEHWCSKLKDKEDIFAKCHSTVNPESYYKRCKYSSCICEKSEDCLCAVSSSYVRACAAKGVFLQSWRDTICEKYTQSCPGSQIFNYKVQQCQRTCDSLSLERQGCSTDYVPVDGCACPEGLYESENGDCVTMDKCPCYHNGEHIKPGKSINVKNDHCICTNGKLQCHSWRSRTTGCPAPKVFFNCSTTGPDEHGLECAPTCAQKNIDCYLSDCESGCKCPAGLLDDGNGYCVKEHDCPCKHDNHFYAPGSQITDECNKCICKRGEWDCTKNICPGTCTIYGSGHYNTFDKQRFAFNGFCSYIAAQNNCGNKTGTFHVITENVQCGTTGTACSKAVRIILGKTELVLRDGKLTEANPVTDPSIKFNVRHVGLYLVIESDIGLTVLWDFKTTVRIILQPNHKGEVCGLCGNYNGNGKDDFTTQESLHVSDVLEFVNSWRLDSRCPDANPDFDPCIQTQNRHTWAKLQCSIIKSDTFKECHDKVEWTPYFENCVKDSCSCDTGGDCECFCTAVAAYAQACNEAGVCVAWRTPEICPVFCDYYNHLNECIWHYSPCETPCYKTCLNPNDTCTNPLPHLEGCYPKCPEDKPIFDEKNQVCVEECPGCFINGTEYTPGEEVPTKKPCNLCYCGENGQEICFPKPGCCFYNGTEYNDNDVIYNVTDNMGTCYKAICINSTVINSSYPCPITTTRPPSTPEASTTPKPEPTTMPVFTTESTTSQQTVTTPPPPIVSTTTPEGSTTPKPEPTTTPVFTTESTPSQQTVTTPPPPIVSTTTTTPKPEPTTTPVFTTESTTSQQTVTTPPPPIVSTTTTTPKPEPTTTPVFTTESTTSQQTVTTPPPIVSTTTPIGSTTLKPEPTTTPVFTTESTTSQQTVTTLTPEDSTTPKPTTTLMMESTPTPETKKTTHYVSTSTGSTTTMGPTPCTPICEWSDWINVYSPQKEGDDLETYENIKNSNIVICEHPEDIQCRSALYPNFSLEDFIQDTGQVVQCNVSFGLVCEQKKQTARPPKCFDYEIRVLCCSECLSTTTIISTTSPTSSTTVKGSTTPETESTGTTKPSITSVVTATTTPISSSTTKGSTTLTSKAISTTEQTTKPTTTLTVITESTTSQQTVTTLPPIVSTTTPIGSTTPKPEPTTMPVFTTESTTSQQTVTTPPPPIVSTTTPIGSTTPKPEPTTTPVFTTESTTSQQTVTTPPPIVSTITPIGSTTPKPEPTTTPVFTTESTTSQQTVTTPPPPPIVSTTTPEGSTTPKPEPTTMPVFTTESTTSQQTVTTPPPPIVSTTTPEGSTTPKPEPTTMPVFTTESTTSQQTVTTPPPPIVSTTTPIGSTTPKPEPTTTPVFTTESTTSQQTVTTPSPIVSTTALIGSTTPKPEPTTTPVFTTESTTSQQTVTTPPPPIVSTTTPEGSTTPKPEPTTTPVFTTESTTSQQTVTTPPPPIVSTTTPEGSTTPKPEPTTMPVFTTESTTSQQTVTTPPPPIVSTTTPEGSTTPKPEPTTMPVFTTESTTSQQTVTTPPPPIVSTTTPEGSTTPKPEPTTMPVFTTESTTSQQTVTTPPPPIVSTTTPIGSTTPKPEPTTTPVFTTESTTSQQTVTTPSPIVSTTALIGSTTPKPEPTTTPVFTTESTTSQQTVTTPPPPIVSTTTPEGSTTPKPEPTTTPVFTTESTTSQQTVTTPPPPIVSTTTPEGSTTPKPEPTTMPVFTTESTTSQQTVTTPPPPIVSTTTPEGSTTPKPEPTTMPVFTTESTTSQQTVTTPPPPIVSTTTPIGSTTPKPEPTTTPVFTTESTTSQQTVTTPSPIVSTTAPIGSTTPKPEPTTTPVFTTESTTSQQTVTTPPPPIVSTTTPEGSTTPKPEPTTTPAFTTASTTSQQTVTTPPPIVSTTTPIGSTTLKPEPTTTPVFTTESTTSQQTVTTPPPIVSTITPIGSTTPKPEPTTTPVFTTESTTSQQTVTTPPPPIVSTTTPEGSTTPKPEPTTMPVFTTESTTSQQTVTTPPPPIVSTTTPEGSTTPKPEPTTTPVFTTESTTSQQTVTTPPPPIVSTTTPEGSTTPKPEPTTMPVFTTESTTSQQTVTTPPPPIVSTTTPEGSTTPKPEPTTMPVFTTESTTSQQTVTTPPPPIVSTTTPIGSTTPKPEPTTTPVFTTESTTSQQTVTTPSPIVSTTAPIGSTTPKPEPTTTPVFTTESTTSQQTVTTPPPPIVSTTTPEGSTTPKPEPTTTPAFTTASTTSQQTVTTPPPIVSTTTPIGSTTLKPEPTTTPVFTTESTTSQQTVTTPPPIVSTITPIGSTTPKPEPTTTPVFTTESTTSQQTVTTPPPPIVSTTTPEGSTTPKPEPTTMPVFTTESTTSQQTVTTPPPPIVSTTTPEGSPTPKPEPTTTPAFTTASTTSQQTVTTPPPIVSTTTPIGSTTLKPEPTTTPVFTAESTTSQQTVTTTPPIISTTTGSTTTMGPTVTTPSELTIQTDISVVTGATTKQTRPTSAPQVSLETTSTPEPTRESTTSHQTFTTTPHPVSTTTPKPEGPTTEQTTKPTTTPVTTTTECFCIINGKHYKPGEPIFEDKDIGSGVCLTMICSDICVIHNTTRPCPTIPPPEKNCTEWGVTENEIFEICNCTLARCIENNTIEIIPYECPPLQNITCANGKSPVLVPDEYHCCEYYACDCFCEGWGDPHYITFDGRFYSYQGECTFVLMEEIRPKHHLKMYIDNINCDPRESVSCPRAIIVAYNNLEITLKNHNLIGAAKLEALMWNSTLKLPFEEHGLRVVSSGLNLILQIPQLNVVVTFGVTGFSVNLPFEYFGNNTQGHCGTCNNNMADDCMLPGGKLVEDCAIMANYWQAKDIYNPDCKPPPLEPETAAPTKAPCSTNAVCELLKSNLFKDCHPHVSPGNYFTGCQFDSCHMSNPAVVCTSVQTYALACSQYGICINWRNHTDLCSAECPADKVYQPCGPADPPTCKDKPEDHYLNITTEGCFCPDGTQLFSKESGVCVDKCGCLDPSGQGREFGEKFQYGCEDCVCDEATVSTICKPRQCSNSSNQLTCSDPGFIVVNGTDPSDTCCTILTCSCESSTCPSVNAECSIGYTPVFKVPEGKCCPEYICEPKSVCVHKGLEYEPGTAIPVIDCQECHCTKDVDPNSKLYKVRCGMVNCNEKCEPGYGYVELDTEECCGKCVKTQCVLNYNGTVHILENGAEWAPSDNVCDKFICTMIDGEYVTTNYKIQCPPFDIHNCQPGTVQHSADHCCQVCVNKDNGCKVQTIFDYITHNNCRSKTTVEQTHCQGHCNSYSKYTDLGSSSCSCCQASRTVNHTVTLDCLTREKVDYTYFHVEACSCDQTKCLGNIQSTRIEDTRRRRSIRLP